MIAPVAAPVSAASIAPPTINGPTPGISSAASPTSHTPDRADGCAFSGVHALGLRLGFLRLSRDDRDILKLQPAGKELIHSTACLRRVIKDP